MKISKTKERILYSAARLFAEKCYADVSMREIAQETGIQAASIYNHFASKAQILDGLFVIYRERMDKFNEVGEALDFNEEPYENFKKLIFVYEPEELPLMKNLMRIVYNEQFRSEKAAAIIYQTSIEERKAIYLNFFKSLEDRGNIKRGTSEYYADIIVNISVQYAMKYVSPFFADSPGIEMGEMLQFIFNLAMKTTD